MRTIFMFAILFLFSLVEMIIFSVNLAPSASLGTMHIRRGITSLPPTILLPDPPLPEIPDNPALVHIPEELRQWMENFDPSRKNEAQQKEYDESLRKHQQKLMRLESDWLSDPNATCFRQSVLPCNSLPDLSSDLPHGFNGACAPSFILIGSPKSGSTSLYYYLVSHPQVNQALSGIFNKEVRYFTDFWTQGTSWYLQQFPPVTPYDLIFPEDSEPHAHMINGEASPTYFYDRHAPSRVKAVTPNAKLIVILRNPIDRAYSEKMQLLANKIMYVEDPYEDMKYQIEEYRKCIAELTNQKDFPDPTDKYFHCYRSPALSTGRLHHEPYLLHSLYVHQVRNWLRYFPQQQLLFIKKKDMYEDPAKTMNKVTDFLGLCQWEWDDVTSKIHNRKEKRYPKMSKDLRKMLDEFFEEYNYQLYDEIGIDFDWENK